MSLELKADSSFCFKI